MHRFLPAIALGLTLVFIAGPAFGNMCPTLIKKINDATATRYDPTAADAKVKAQQAAALHAAGKHEESVKLATEALNALGIK